MPSVSCARLPSHTACVSSHPVGGLIDKLGGLSLLMGGIRRARIGESMHTIYFKEPGTTGWEEALQCTASTLYAARCVWDALERDGYIMVSQRP